MKYEDKFETPGLSPYNEDDEEPLRFSLKSSGTNSLPIDEIAGDASGDMLENIGLEYAMI